MASNPIRGCWSGPLTPRGGRRRDPLAHPRRCGPPIAAGGRLRGVGADRRFPLSPADLRLWRRAGRDGAGRVRRNPCRATVGPPILTGRAGARCIPAGRRRGLHRRAVLVAGGAGVLRERVVAFAFQVLKIAVDALIGGNTLTWCAVACSPSTT